MKNEDNHPKVPEYKISPSYKKKENRLIKRSFLEMMFKQFKCKTCRTVFLVEVRGFYNMTKQELSVKCPRCSLVVLNTKFANKIRETYGLEKVHEEIVSHD